jgi:hypothetical protein
MTCRRTGSSSSFRNIPDSVEWYQTLFMFRWSRNSCLLWNLKVVPACRNGAIFQETQSESYLLRWSKIQILRDPFVRLAYLINHLALGLCDSCVTDSAHFFSRNSVTQFSPHASAHTCSLHSPVSSLACHFAAAACPTVKHMSRYQKRCNAGSTPAGGSYSLPLNIAHKSVTCVDVIYVI